MCLLSPVSAQIDQAAAQPSWEAVAFGVLGDMRQAFAQAPGDGLPICRSVALDEFAVPAFHSGVMP